MNCGITCERKIPWYGLYQKVASFLVVLSKMHGKNAGRHHCDGSVDRQLHGILAGSDSQVLISAHRAPGVVVLFTSSRTPSS